MKNLLVAFLLCLPFLTGCKKEEERADNNPLIVILSPDNPPFEFKDTAQEGDEPLGFDVDVVKELSRRLGRPLKIIEAEFGALIPSLQAGRADIAISELTPSEERKKSVDFSDSYYSNPSALLVPQISSILSEADLEGKRLGVQLGSANEAIARTWAETIPHLSIISLGKVGELAQELKNKRLDAVLVGGKVAHNIAAAAPEFKVVAVKTTTGKIAMAFPKGSSLVEPVNAALRTMDIEIEKLAEKWMGK